MNITTILPIVALALASCQTVTNEVPNDESPAAASTPGYRAIGTEPFWSLTIDGKNMIFNRAGEEDIFGSDTVSRPSINGWRHVSKTMTADVTFTQCSDGMSDRIYKDSVTVMVGKETYKGCGGGIIAPQSLENTHWRVTFINGDAISADRDATFNFADGRMSGSVGCNRLSASYSYAGKTLEFGPVMSTKMACPDPIGTQEHVFVSLLNAMTTAEFNNDGSWLLTGQNGASVVLEQLI